MKSLKRTIGIIIVMAAIISGLQLKSELAYGATPTISKSTVTLENVPAVACRKAAARETAPTRPFSGPMR